MLRRIGVVIGGLFLSAILANLYYMVFCVIIIVAFGIQNDAFLRVGFVVCFLLALATSAFLFRKAW